MAWSTSSGIFVGPGTARNSRPARTVMAASHLAVVAAYGAPGLQGDDRNVLHHYGFRPFRGWMDRRGPAYSPCAEITGRGLLPPIAMDGGEDGHADGFSQRA